MKAQLSNKDLVKWGLHESARGRYLNQIEADFHQRGIDRSAAIKALKDIDYINKREERKANQKSQAAKVDDKNTAPKNEKTAEADGKKKPSLLLQLIFLALIAVILYLLYLNINLK